jgi:hypothetical protein
MLKLPAEAYQEFPYSDRQGLSTFQLDALDVGYILTPASIRSKAPVLPTTHVGTWLNTPKLELTR